MKLVVFGATGFAGWFILSELIRRQHHVRMLVRDISRAPESTSLLEVITGDAMDRKAIARTMEGCDVVIQCLGVGGKGDGKPTTFISDATRIITEEMERQGIKRLIALSNVGAGNSIAFQPWFFTKIILPYFMKWLKVIIEDKNRMEPIIMNSNLDWTIVRCPNIVDKPAKGSWNATLDGKGLKLSVTRADLAVFIADQLNMDIYVRQAPCISN